MPFHSRIVLSKFESNVETSSPTTARLLFDPFAVESNRLQHEPVSWQPDGDDYVGLADSGRGNAASGVARLRRHEKRTKAIEPLNDCNSP
jgi:hypothetical protein